jgi:hypothetical protein
LRDQFIVGDKADPSIRFDFCVSRNLGSGDSFRFNCGVLGTASSRRRMAPSKKSLDGPPISTNKRKTVDTAPVVAGCDLLDWATSTVIYFLHRDNRLPYQSRGFSARSW